MRDLIAIRSFEGLEGRIKKGQRFEAATDLRFNQLIQWGLARDANQVELPPNAIIRSSPGKETKDRTVSLVTGQAYEAPIATGGTIAADTENFRIGSQGWRVTTTAATTATAKFNYSPLLSFPPASTVCLWVHVPDAAAVKQITLELHYPNGKKWTRTALSADLKNGWNLARFPATAGMVLADLADNWGKGMDYVRFVIVTNGAASLTIGHLFVECPAKAKLIFIEDGGYTTFLDSLYPDLVKRGLPVTWSLDPAKLGTETGENARITENDVARLATENNNTMNFHGYDGAPTAAMDAAGTVADTMKAIQWLQQKGYFEDLHWRSAWVQNSAPNAAATKGILIAYATPTSAAALDTFPPIDQWNIPRIAIHGREQSYLNDLFTMLEVTHQTLIAYTHGLSETKTTDVNRATWDYFINLVDRGLSEEWLEGVTFNELLERYKINPVTTWVQDFYQNKRI